MADKPKTEEEYRDLISDVIKKQIVVLGPNIAILKAKGVGGLEIDKKGNVIRLKGEPQKVLQKLIDRYVALSGQIVKSTIEPLLAKYPALKMPSFEKGQKVSQ